MLASKCRDIQVQVQVPVQVGNPHINSTILSLAISVNVTQVFFEGKLDASCKSSKVIENKSFPDFEGGAINTLNKKPDRIK